MDQDATWYGGILWPRPHCVRWGPSSPRSKGHRPPIFGPCLLLPNGWIDQDATWYDVRPWPRPHCVRWGPRSPQKGAQSLQFFWPMCIVAKWSLISATAEHFLWWSSYYDSVVAHYILIWFWLRVCGGQWRFENVGLMSVNVVLWSRNLARW